MLLSPLLLTLALRTPLALPIPLPGPAGQVIERVACETDPTQNYALYLPSSYSPAREWPIVFLMDPRGRALVPLMLFAPAAERRGYILVSSYDTLSDGPAEPNVKAMNAMLPDVRQRFSMDPRRLYLAGFSGTARMSWEFGTHLKAHVAGIIGFGGGLPQGFSLSEAPGFAFFGGAGTTDFNYEEMRALDAKLARIGAAHRFRSFDGAHSWGTAQTCAEAIDWMEVQAMRSGLRDKSAAIVDEIFSAWMEEAHGLEASGDPYAATARYRGIAADFSELRDTGDAAPKADELARTKGARRTASLTEKLAARQKTYETRFFSYIMRFSSSTPPPPLEDSLAQLQIAALKARSADDVEPVEALAARRLLALALVYTSYYLPRDFMERKDPGRALAVLKIAAQIKPASPGICLGLARARAQIGQKAQAIEDLRCVVAAPEGIDAALIENDPYLAPLRDEAGYREILDHLRAASAVSPKCL